MSVDNLKDEDEPVKNLLGPESSRPNVKLRRGHPVNRRSKGIVFQDDFQITPDQEAADKDLLKQTYHGKNLFQILIYL